MHVELQQSFLIRSDLVAAHILQNVQLALPHRPTLPSEIISSDQWLLVHPSHSKLHLLHQIILPPLLSTQSRVQLHPSALHVEFLHSDDVAINSALLV